MIASTRAIFTAAAMVAMLAPSAAQAQMPDDPKGLTGVYGGSYICPDGEHGAILEVTGVEPHDMANYPYRISARLAFFPIVSQTWARLGKVAGSFTMRGTIAKDGAVQLMPTEWIVEPKGYGWARLQGRFAPRADGLMAFEGKPQPNGGVDCRGLIATRALPAMGKGIE